MHALSLPFTFYLIDGARTVSTLFGVPFFGYPHHSASRQAGGIPCCYSDAPYRNIRPFGDGLADADVRAELDGEIGVVVAQLFHFAEEVERVFDGLQRLEVDDVGDVDGEVHGDEGAAVRGHDDVLLVDADAGGDFLVLV